MSGMMGLNIGIKALRAQQRALDVVGHNIANANTEGYSRQRAEMTTTLPYTMPSLYDLKQAGQVGTGVEVSAIVRLREGFVDERFRDNRAYFGLWEQRANTLHEIESIFNEPSEDGLRTALDGFWSSLQQLQNHADDVSIRATVRESASALTDVFSSYYTQLEDYKKALNQDVNNKVTEINSMAQRIADLNSTISTVYAKGEQANDLMDKRDLLVDQLSKLANISVQYDSRNNALVSIGGNALVNSTGYAELVTVNDANNNGQLTVVWKDTKNPLQLSGGELAGIIDSRDNIVQSYMDKLDDVAGSLIQNFNRVHRNGIGLNNSTGIDFFAGSGAADIRVSDDIMDETNGENNIAAALALDSIADGRNASLLSEVLRNSNINGKQTSLSDYWAGTVATLGIESQRAIRLQDNHGTIEHQLMQQKSSISGVSLDEEMSNLIMYQHAYNAAAKLISTQSEMLDMLVGIIK